MKYTLYILSIVLFFLFTTDKSNASNVYSNSSVLHSGKWVKIRIKNTGIYKVTYAQLKEMGFSDPNKVSLYGYGGTLLPENFASSYQDDLPQVALKKGDNALLFYGVGTTQWEFNPFTFSFQHTTNHYSDYGYYFLSDIAAPKTINTIAYPQQASIQIDTFDDYIVYEKDLYSPNKSGRELFGESFISKLSQDFNFTIPGITPDDGKVTLRFVAKALNTYGQVKLAIDGTNIITGNISQTQLTGDDSYIKATPLKKTNDWIGQKAENTKVTITYNNSSHQNVYLDYIELNMKRKLKCYDAFTCFRSINSRYNDTRFNIENATSQTEVWDVTNTIEPQQIETSLKNNILSYNVPKGSLREFVVLQADGDFPSPEIMGEVENQNLHGLPQVDMVIISPKNFKEQAERLAEMHRTKDNLSVEIIEPSTIYNEFSSGTPDATAYRRLMKMFYDRKTSTTDAPKYLLLFGDAAYDNRQANKATWGDVDFSNMLLSYQSKESLNGTSYVTDDYFGFLDNNEGANIAIDNLDLGIGRIPVRTIAEATNAVDKIIKYRDNTLLHNWKNKLCFIADDGNNADGYMTQHMLQSNTIADYVTTNHPEFLVKKLFFDSFKKDKTSGNGSYPDVETALEKNLKEGLFILNYTGHGNSESWSDELILKQSDVLQANYSSLPLWITASCDFTRFDEEKTSSGEYVFLNKNSGGIALFTTTRVVYSEPNFTINNALMKNIFAKENGEYLTLGEIIRRTKNDIGTDYNKLNFILIGDPALKLGYPEYKIEITEINGTPISSTPIQIKALEKVTLKGNVIKSDGTDATNFNGDATLTVLDSEVAVTTLDNNNTGNKFQYSDYPNTLYTGNTEVKNGTFDITFTVPIDILYSNEKGKMNLYASDPTTGKEAQGAYTNFTIGGTSGNISNDTKGPEIRSLYLNDNTFTDGGEVNETPFFFATVYDESGINISGGSIGHDLILKIDNSPTQTYNLNNYYQSTTEKGKEGEGTIGFSIPALTPGLHSGELKVWDIANNSTTTSFNFVVKEGQKPAITKIQTAPNPAKTTVTFYISHNRPETNLTATMYVFDLTGKLQWKYKTTGSSSLEAPLAISWDLCNNNGSRLPAGIYIYQAAIKDKTSTEVTKSNKLIILGQ